MSGFVPFRQGAKFAAGLMDSPTTPVADDAPRSEVKTPIEVAEPAATVEQVSDGLPKTAEELQVLIDEARAEARDSAEAARADPAG